MSQADLSIHDYEDTLKLHEKNYALFRARTLKECNDVIHDSLKTSGFACIYYSVIPSGLERDFSFDPQTRKTLHIPFQKFELSAPDMVRYFSERLVVSSIENSNLPQSLLAPFLESHCEAIAVICAQEDVTTAGVMMLGAKTEAEFSALKLSPLLQLADTIPVALANIRASRATQQRLREMEAIAETSQQISTSNNLASLYELLHQQIRATIGDVRFSVSLYDAQTDTIEIPYSGEGEQITSHGRFPLGEGLASLLIRSHQPLMIVEDAELRIQTMGAKVTGKVPQSWLGCPLIMGGEVIGALEVQDDERQRRFGPDELRLLTSLSAQVAGAVYNIRLLEDARRRALQLETVAEISREVSSALLLDNLLLQAVDLIRERFRFYHAAVFLVDPSGEYAVVREATGDAGIQMKRAGHKLAIGSQSIVGYVAKSKEPLIVNDITRDPNYYANPLLPDTKAEAAIPLSVGPRLLGVLDVQSTSAYGFSDENVKILQILADQLAVAVVNTELFAEAQERLSQHRLLHHVTTAAASSTTIEDALNSAVQGLQVTLGGDQIAILLADKEQKMLDVRASIGYPNEESARLKIPFGVGITGWVAANRKPQRIGDVAKDSRYVAVNNKIKSELAIPLIYRNEVLGVLNVESPRMDAYTENDEEMLGTLAGSLAAIIAHSRLLEQFRFQVERERMLYEVTSRIRRTSNAEKILALTTNEINKVLTTQRVSIRVDLSKQRTRSEDKK